MDFATEPQNTKHGVHKGCAEVMHSRSITGWIGQLCRAVGCPVRAADREPGMHQLDGPQVRRTGKRSSQCVSPCPWPHPAEPFDSWSLTPFHGAGLLRLGEQKRRQDCLVGGAWREESRMPETWCVTLAEADRLMDMGSEAEKCHLLQCCQPHKGRGPGSFGCRDPCFLQRRAPRWAQGGSSGAWPSESQ